MLSSSLEGYTHTGEKKTLTDLPHVLRQSLAEHRKYKLSSFTKVLDFYSLLEKLYLDPVKDRRTKEVPDYMLSSIEE